MKLLIRTLPFLLVVMWLTASAAPPKEACELPEGLYARRQTLKQQYSEQIRTGYLNNKEAANQTMTQIRVLDQHYRTLYSRLCGAAREEDIYSIEQCCSNAGYDPIAEEICNLERYLDNEEGTTKSFVQTFPQTSREIGVLWELDEISNGPQGLLVTECGSIGLVDLYVNKLFGLVAIGDRQALQRFVNLSQHAEGAYADGLTDQIKTLFVEKPSLVLDQWPVIRRFPHIEEIGAEFIDEEQATVERNFHKLCVRPSQTCAEIERAISAPRD
jgi:hypothetical protein